MSVLLRVLLVIVCFMTSGYTLRKIRKSQMQIEDSLFWILFSFGLVVLSIFPGIATQFADFLGILSPVNFVFLSVIFLLLIKVFLLSLRISQLEDKIKRLVQRNVIEEEKRREEKNKEKQQTM